MNKISEQQFLIRQPAYPRKSPTDPFYYRLANRLADIIAEGNLLPDWPESVCIRVALSLTGYLQDILTDSGIWRSFINRHNELYGRWLPFYELSEDYIPHELNEEDVRFIIWYVLTMNFEERRVWNPLDKDIENAAAVLHKELDKVYEDDDTPIPEDYHISRGLELGNPAEADDVFHFGNWLFMHCWLMTPAYAMTLTEMMMNPELQGGENMDLLRRKLEESMMEDPTGPLALYLREWLFLIIENRMPPAPKNRPVEPEGEHPYYTKFMAATGGKRIAFFKTYDELNAFFCDALGWGKGENLPALKHSSDFVLLVNPTKGMLCAKDVAKCILMEGNPYYDKEYAREHAIELLTERGICPGDLLQYLFENDALPDACFPGTHDMKLVAENRDFIARCYLQKYYRGD